MTTEVRCNCGAPWRPGAGGRLVATIDGTDVNVVAQRWKARGEGIVTDPAEAWSLDGGGTLDAQCRRCGRTFLLARRGGRVTVRTSA